MTARPLRDDAPGPYRLRGCALAALVAAMPASARAEAGGDCRLASDPRLQLGWAQVVGRTPAHFVKDASDSPECPADLPRCQAKAFLVTGDQVIVGRRQNGFACVDFIGKPGHERTGWLPATALQPEPAQAVPADGWVGHWTMIEADVTISRGSGGKLIVAGTATYGAQDPERVRRGALHVGSIEGTVLPDGAKLSFGMGADATVPVDKADDSDCKVWMQRVGPYLAVDDNNACGGMNVTFSGVYRKH